MLVVIVIFLLVPPPHPTEGPTAPLPSTVRESTVPPQTSEATTEDKASTTEWTTTAASMANITVKLTNAIDNSIISSGVNVTLFNLNDTDLIGDCKY